MSVNNYYPGSIWSFYEDGAFGPGAPTPVNRRNPRAEVKLTKKGVPRKPPTAGQIAWRKQFGQMMKKVETKALLSRSVKASNMGQHLRAAWAEIYPISKRKPKHHADIENHVKQVVANNNPNASFVDYPRATLYSEVQGQYGFDPRFGNVPPNRRNPKGAAGQMEARFPGKCGLCGGEYDRGDAIAIVEGAAGPRGGKVRKHAGC